MQARIAAEMTVLNPVGLRLLLQLLAAASAGALQVLLPVGRVGACQTEVVKLMLRL